MKVSFRVRPELLIEIEEKSQKDLFKALAEAQEVFGEKTCGKCGKSNLKFSVRENDGNFYYELICLDCGAKLSFGAHKKGESLFPRRSEEDEKGNKKRLNSNGWLKWNPTKKISE